MLETYKGMRIDPDIIIVEKQNDEHQGFVVSKNAKGQIDTAMHWAKYNKPVKNENGDFVYEYYYYFQNAYHYFDTEEAAIADAIANGFTERNVNRCTKSEQTEGIVHEYTNGQFTLSLSESANGSSQGGKLSFWNCSITAEDGNTYLIGINQDCLISLLLHNTFINGVCQSKVWLGRVKNNVGAFTENMEEFQQGKSDEEFRKIKPTNKYEEGSYLPCSKKLYIGKYYKYFDVYSSKDYDYRAAYGYDTADIPRAMVSIYLKPKLVYAFVDLWNTNMFDRTTQTILNYKISQYDLHFYSSKPAEKIVSSTKVAYDEEKFWTGFKEHYENEHKYDIESTSHYMKSTDPIFCEALSVLENPPTKYDILRSQYQKELDLSKIKDIENYFINLGVQVRYDISKEDAYELFDKDRSTYML